MLTDLEGAPLGKASSIENPRLRQLIRAMHIINDDLGWRWALTSYIRNDNRAHAEGRAVDFAARSGPLWELRKRFSCPMYHRRRYLKDACSASVDPIAELCPNVHLILIEPDHLHIELSKYRSPRRVDVVTYAARTNALCPALEPGQRIIRQLPITGDVHYADEDKKPSTDASRVIDSDDRDREREQGG